MTRPSGVDAELNLSALPILEGAEETSAAGILSSLQPANVRLRRALRTDPLTDFNGKIILDAAWAAKVHPEILAQHNIPSDRSDDLK